MTGPEEPDRKSLLPLSVYSSQSIENRGNLGWLTSTDPLRVLTTVGFPVLQFNAEKKQFVAFSNVRKAESQVVRFSDAKLPFDTTKPKG